MPKIKADITFNDANRRKETVQIDSIKINLISYLDLIKDKQATARKKDFEDIQQLEKIRGKE